MNQEFNFTRVLSAIAASKQVKDPKAWVSSHFDHARITDQGALLHADHIPYGVKDVDWEHGQRITTQPLHFTAYAVTSHPDTGRVVRLVRFSGLSDKVFLDLLRELYYDAPECARELLVYYDLTDIRFRLLDQAGHEIRLGDDSNTLDPADGETVMEHDLYTLTVPELDQPFCCDDQVVLALEALNYHIACQRVPEDDQGTLEAYTEPHLRVCRGITPLDYRFFRDTATGAWSFALV